MSLVMPDTDPATRLRIAVEASIGERFTPGNRVTPLRNGVEIFPAMLGAIAEADRTIDFVTYVYWTGDIARRFADALAERSRAGVRVRVILDGFGSAPMDQSLIDAMTQAGVQVTRFRPPVRWKVWEADHRTHRKILVIDETVAFTGGVGIATEWEGDARSPSEWRDTHFRLEGPAVMGLRAAFLTDWRDTEHPIDPSDVAVEAPDEVGDTPVAVIDGSAQIGLNDAARVLEALVSVAKDRIRLCTPYFNPKDGLHDLLGDAARRGVDVAVLVPGPHIDKRVSAVAAADAYIPLLQSGVQVWRYQPTMLHTKAVLVDGALSLLGSVNVNRRSVEKDEEVAIAVLDEGLTAVLESHFDEDVSRSEPADARVEPTGWRRAVGSVIKPIKGEL